MPLMPIDNYDFKLWSSYKTRLFWGVKKIRGERWKFRIYKMQLMLLGCIDLLFRYSYYPRLWKNLGVWIWSEWTLGNSWMWIMPIEYIGYTLWISFTQWMYKMHLL